ncbi:MAG: glycoside hydrolase family 2, partial [Arcanobacterium sp.]|nr:glycoside hydrolase family 2 [Arcanobacterium sp.]
MVREEYPRPQLRRDNWCNLNGEWEFCFDDSDAGLRERWFDCKVPFNQRITVPYVYEAPLSGIDTRDRHEVVWYRREFDTPHMNADNRVLLHFGAVDYEARVFLNGVPIAVHEGGETPFTVDITAFLRKTDTQILTVRVYDPLEDQEIPRGKQFWGEKPLGIWYTRSTGIWQTVWYEIVPRSYFERVVFTPDIDAGLVGISVKVAGALPGQRVAYSISYKGQSVAEGENALVAVSAGALQWQVDLAQGDIFRTGFHTGEEYMWSPEFPNLFDVELSLVHADREASTDCVWSYFGLPKIHAEHGMIFLNNKPYYQKLVLDQGYWPEGLLTAPTDDSFKRDIQLAKEMG